MNRLLWVALLVLITGSCIESLGPIPGGIGPEGLGGLPGGGGGAEDSECFQTLAPTPDEFQLMQVAAAVCAGEQGVADILSSFQISGGGAPDASALLEASGYSEEAVAMRKCIANEMGMLNEDGSFAMDILKDSILAKVEEQSVEDNTQLGLDNCPDVVDYDFPTYMQCIMVYCTTGVAP